MTSLETLDIPRSLVERLARELASLDSDKSRAPVGRLAFSAAETCALLGCSAMSLHRLDKRGLLVPVRHLRHRLYSRAAIDRYLTGAPLITTKASRKVS